MVRITEYLSSFSCGCYTIQAGELPLMTANQLVGLLDNTSKSSFVFDSQKKNVSVMTSVWPGGPVSVHDRNYHIAIFSDTVNMINTKFCMMVIFIAL